METTHKIVRFLTLELEGSFVPASVHPSNLISSVNNAQVYKFTGNISPRVEALALSKQKTSVPNLLYPTPP